MALFDSLMLNQMRRWVPLVIIVIITVTASINRHLVSLTMQPVKLEFGLSDTQIGGLFSIAGVIIALASPVLGQLVDRVDRHRLMLVAIIIWSTATASFGLAGGYLALALSLAVLASAETTLVPLSNSMIADQFRGGGRINANLIYFAAGGLTTGVGTYVGGALLQWSAGSFPSALFGPVMSDWRIAMMITAMMGIPLVCLALVLGRDSRPRPKKSATDIDDLKIYLRQHWPALASFNIANAGYFITATAVMTWIPIYIVRRFEISPAELGMQIGLVVGVADVLGVLIGFTAIKWLYAQLGPIAPRYIFQVSLGLIALVSLIQLAANSLEMMLFLLGIQNFLATFGTASFNNMVQDMSSSEIRGKVFGINALIISIISIPGPLLVGVISDNLGDTPQALLWATMLVSIPALLFSILVFSLTNSSFLSTVRAMASIELGATRSPVDRL